MKPFVYALTVAVALSATPALANPVSDTAVNADTSAQSVSQPDEGLGPLAAQLQRAQRGDGPTFGDDARATRPAQEHGMTVAPYPNSERPAFD